MSDYKIYILMTPEAAIELCDMYDVWVNEYTYIDATDSEKLLEIYNKEIETSRLNTEAHYHMDNISEYKEQMDNSILLISVFVYGFIILMSMICIANIVNTISTSLALRRREFAMIKSVGMTDKAFNKMIAFESAFYGIKALIFGLPVGTLIMLFIRFLMSNEYEMDMGIPWIAYVISIVGVFVVVGMTMVYSAGKIKKANIIVALREESV